MTSQDTLAARLKRLRAATGLSQQGLAEAAGLSIKNVQNLEQGRRGRPRLDTLQALARALGCGVGELAGE